MDDKAKAKFHIHCIVIIIIIIVIVKWSLELSHDALPAALQPYHRMNIVIIYNKQE